ncbi:hypothetical protein MNV49_003760 [Pseudohyphozyma bogoriensis]|nr:hypothetical protein MNV49_003760 [Pseudohyphozyma bogoriensis]
MSSTFVHLLLLSFLMATGTLLAAFTPFLLSLSAKRISVVSTYAVGLLVGAALTIVVPEGVETLYDARGDRQGHETELAGWVGGTLLAGFLLM